MDLSTLEEQLQGLRFNIHQPDGRVLRVGHEGTVVDWHIHSDRVLQNILDCPQRNLGHSYVKGGWAVDTLHLSTLIEALIPRAAPAGLLRHGARLRRLRARLRLLRAAAAKPRWQDSSLWLSRLCLGEELFEGCPHFSEPGISLEQAQRTRCRNLMARLRLRRGQHLLDLNAGWGAVPLYLAQHTGSRVTALVSSRDQLQFAYGEARRRGLDGRVHFRLGSFLHCRGRFDRIIAGDFLERHPEPAFNGLFERLEALLEDDGMIWLEATGRSCDASLSNQWHEQNLPARHSQPLLSALNRAVEHTRLRTLLLQDLSDYRLLGLQAQARRFHGNRAAISQHFGETQTRYWEFLLASQMTALRWGQLRQYELVLGNARCRWPADTNDGLKSEARLPVDIARRIPGLARGS
jgi:cyclopropane-fatty-acyl-phospholipid synthase